MRRPTWYLVFGWAIAFSLAACGDSGHPGTEPLCDVEDCEDAGEPEDDAGGEQDSSIGSGQHPAIGGDQDGATSVDQDGATSVDQDGATSVDQDGATVDQDGATVDQDGATSVDQDASTSVDQDASTSVDGSVPTGDGGDADASMPFADAEAGGDAEPKTPPTAAFSLSVQSGVLPLIVEATSSAAPGTAAIASVRYDFGAGAGFSQQSSYRYLAAGAFTVVQEVTDADGLTSTATLTVQVDDFVPVRFSDTDHGDSVYLSPDRLKVENRGQFAGGVRSNRSIAPGSGVFYFEAQRLIERVGVWGIGVATQAAPLAGLMSYDTQILAQDGQSLGIATDGRVLTKTPIAGCSDQTISSANEHYGFVIDYRAQNPVLHVVAEDAGGTPAVRASCPTTLSDPLFIYYAGVRYEVGYQLKINAGSDLTNFPFYYGPDVVRMALSDAGYTGAASALVPGFGQTRSPAPNAAPVIVKPQDLSVPLNMTLELMATASDAEDGDLTASLVWTDISTQHHAPLTGTGGSFSFTPTILGVHPIDITVRDWDDHEVTERVYVTVTGTLPQVATVELLPHAVDPLAGEHVEISGGGLDAHFPGPVPKEGARANQGIYGQYWYFEAHRLIGPGNMGVGLIIGEGSLDPYHFDTVPWSCSANFGGATISGSTWYNLNSIGTFSQANEYYGFAVDYRGLNPSVHVLVGGPSGTPGGVYVGTIEMPDAWVPIYPMVYGNAQSGSGPDVAVNFGTSTFYLNPITLLNGQGVDTTGLELGWGDVNTTP